PRSEPEGDRGPDVLERFRYLHRSRCLSLGYLQRLRALALGWRSHGAWQLSGRLREDPARSGFASHARETLPRTAYSAMDPRQFLIAFTTDPRQQIYVSGLELVPDAIVVFRAASEGYNRYSASRWSGIALPHEDVAAAGQTLIGRELIAPPNTQLIKPPPPLFSKLLKLD